MEQRQKQFIYIGRAYFLPLLLLLPALLTACTERSLEVRPEPVPIRLYTGIQTRISIDNFKETPVCVAYGTAPGGYIQCWDGIATNNEITLTPVRYYPQDGSRIYLRSFYPPAPMSADGTLNYTLTGEEDLMMTVEQSATQDEPFTADSEKILTHRHLLTKLSFRLKLNVSNPDLYSVRSLQLNGLTQQVTLSLLTGELNCGELKIPVMIYDGATDGSSFPFKEGVAELPGYVLVQPGAEFTLNLRLAVDDKPANDLIYTELPIHFDGGTGEGGIAYTVSVDIPDPVSPDPVEVSVTATVTSWKDGDSGSGEINTDKGKK